MQKETLDDIFWHTTKVYNMLLYEIITNQEREEKTKEKEENIMRILGLNNLVACTNRDNSRTLIVSGKPLKSKNNYYNEKIRKLQQIEMLKYKKSKKYKTMKQIKREYEKEE